jgi:hypothetical protein
MGLVIVAPVETKNKREPARLRRGKKFHRLIQKEWVTDRRTRDHAFREFAIVKANGRRGRIDILIDEGEDWVAVVEIKASHWDAMKEKHVRRNARRQIRQIWSYIESQLLANEDGTIDGKEVCPGIIFPKAPRKPGRRGAVEALFNQDGIQVVWHNEK